MTTDAKRLREMVRGRRAKLEEKIQLNHAIDTTQYIMSHALDLALDVVELIDDDGHICGDFWDGLNNTCMMCRALDAFRAFVPREGK